MILALLAHLAPWWLSRVTPEPARSPHWGARCWCGWQTQEPTTLVKALAQFELHTHADGTTTIPGGLTVMDTRKEEVPRG
jgi:hypothetical protein